MLHFATRKYGPIHIKKINIYVINVIFREVFCENNILLQQPGEKKCNFNNLVLGVH